MGTISPSLGNLSALSQLNLSHNSISGFVPEGLFASLISLETVDLSFNNLRGDLSAPFASNGSFHHTVLAVDISRNQLYTSKLMSFNVSYNGFIGQIPSSICTISPLLKTLDFSKNNLSGQIPVGLARCSKLEVLRAGFNSLSRPLPADLYSLKSLVELSVPENHISGTIEEGILGLTSLRILDLNSNNISGPIPHDIDKLSNLEQLVVNDNNLSGSLTPLLMNCTNLVKLILRFNSLESNISTLDFSRLTRLQILDFGDNNFTGNIPESIYSCKSLTAIRVARNSLRGQISPKVVTLPSLSYLSLSDNSFNNFTEAIKILAACKSLKLLFLTQSFYNETIPDERSFIRPDGFRNLQILSLRGCNLRGKVPAWLANMKKLQALEMSRNQITGTIPDWLGTLPSLICFDLSHNFLTGEVPVQLSRMPALTSSDRGGSKFKLNQPHFELPILDNIQKTTYRQYNWIKSMSSGIHLKGNNITGNIPVELSQLCNLQKLDLSENLFTGSIPREFSNLTNLEVLDLSHNNLTGELPTSLQSLHFLSELNVSYNNLEGPIPTGGQFDTFTQYSYIGNPKLCGQVLHQSCAHPSVLPGTVKEDTIIESNVELFANGFAIGFSTVFTIVVAIMAFCHFKMLYTNRNG